MTNEYIRPWTRDTNHVQKGAHITTLTCAYQSHVLLAMVALSCGGSGPMPCEDMCVFGMGLEQPQ